MDKDALLAKVNRITGKDYTYRSYFETIQDLVQKVEQQEQEFITLSQSIEEDDAMIQQLQAEVQLYKLHETVLLERVKKAEEKTRFHKYMDLEKENLKMAQKLARLKEGQPV